MYAELVEDVLIDWLDEDRLDRVLYVEPDDRGVILFDMKDEKALPVRKIYRDVLTALEDAKARVLDFDPYLPLPNAEVRPKHRARQDKVWKLIEPLVADEDRAILYKNTRNKLIEKAFARAKEEDLPGKSKHYILKLLRRYWRGGQLKDALLPHYHNSGRPGEAKKDGKKKRGRKGRVKGVNVDKTMQNIIKRALKRDYYTLDKNSLYRTYILMLSQDFGVDIELLDGVEVPILDKGKEYLT